MFIKHIHTIVKINAVPEDYIKHEANKTNFSFWVNSRRVKVGFKMSLKSGQRKFKKYRSKAGKWHVFKQIKV